MRNKHNGIPALLRGMLLRGTLLRGALLGGTLLCGALLCVLLLCGCAAGRNSGGNKTAEASGQQDSSSLELFAMDTYMTLTAYGEGSADALKQAEAVIVELDALLSTGNADSEIAGLNASGTMELSDVSTYLWERSVEVNKMTEGAFNPLVYPLVEAWGFAGGEYQVPDRKTLENLLLLTDIKDVRYDPAGRRISFEKEGMKLDFGGIAKGYTSSRVVDLFRENGIEHAVISLGGNVQTLGAKPDGSRWKVAIRDPEKSSEYLGILETADKAVVTSGGYERYFEQDGKRYHHILDPATGYPAEQGLLSVTIISDDGTLADGLSTALYVTGLEKAQEIWKASDGLFEAVFMTEDHQLYVTKGVADAFASSVYPVHVIQ